MLAARKSVALVAALLLLLTTLAVPVEASHVTVLGRALSTALNWVGGYLFGKGLDRAFGADEEAEFEQHLRTLDQAHASTSAELRQIKDVHRALSQRLSLVEQSQTETTDRQNQLYSKAWNDLQSSGSQIQQFESQTAKLVADLHEVPSLIRRKAQGRLEQIYATGKHLLGKDSQALWVSRVTQMLGEIESQLTALEQEVAALQDETRRQGVQIDQLNKDFRDHDERIAILDDTASEHEDRLSDLTIADRVQGDKLEEHDRRLSDVESAAELKVLEDRERHDLFATAESLQRKTRRSAILVRLPIIDERHARLYQKINETIQSSCPLAVVFEQPTPYDPYRVDFQMDFDIGFADHPGYHGTGSTSSCSFDYRLYRAGERRPLKRSLHEFHGADREVAFAALLSQLDAVTETVCATLSQKK